MQQKLVKLECVPAETRHTELYSLRVFSLTRSAATRPEHDPLLVTGLPCALQRFTSSQEHQARGDTAVKICFQKHTAPEELVNLRTLHSQSFQD